MVAITSDFVNKEKYQIIWKKKVDFTYKRCNNKHLKLIKGVIL
jgi:hypothetical protein